MKTSRAMDVYDHVIYSLSIDTLRVSMNEIDGQRDVNCVRVVEICEEE